MWNDVPVECGGCGGEKEAAHPGGEGEKKKNPTRCGDQAPLALLEEKGMASGPAERKEKKNASPKGVQEKKRDDSYGGKEGACYYDIGNGSQSGSGRDVFIARKKEVLMGELPDQKNSGPTQGTTAKKRTRLPQGKELC